MMPLNRMLRLSIVYGALVLPLHVLAQTTVAWDKLQGLDNTHYFTLEHKPNNKAIQQHHIFIKLPPEYAENKDATFPTLYLLDGGTNFPLFAAYYNSLRWMEDIPPMIVVGLSYGTYDWKEGNNRSHDFTAPSEGSEHYGGANNFDEFLSKVLLPKIQSRYRVDSSRQILFGQSLGGQFALFSAMYGSSPFYAVIASNPALHRNLDFFKQKLNFRQNRPKIFITSAEYDDVRYKQPLNVWHEYWREEKSDLLYEFVELERHNHLSATPESIRLGLKSVLKN